MDIEFRCYMTHLTALRAGFKPYDPFTIAYASQYNDDKVISCGRSQFKVLGKIVEEMEIDVAKGDW